MVERAFLKTLGFIDAFAKLWPMWLSMILVIGWCYTLQATVTGDHQAVQEEAVKLSSIDIRVHTLEDDGTNSSNDNRAQFQVLEQELQDISHKEDEIAKNVGDQANKLAVYGDRVNLLMSRDYPNSGAANP